MPLPPSPSEQIRFLQQLQRVLDEGAFVATYKYALLHAIADLCVRLGDDSGAPLELRTRDIAERFVELYWPQVVPFPAGEEPDVFRQNTGRQAAIVRRIRETRERYAGSLAYLKHDKREWGELVGAVDRTVCTMPLWKLQTVGQKQIEFLYENLGRGRRITLNPGVAYCFRAFYPMITDMVEGAWAQYVRRYNREVLGETTDLRGFLFGSERAPLLRYRPILEDIQDGRCFYCDERLRGQTDVDHFIPWRRYPVDLGHNFVLAHGACNAHKGDRLAAEPHLRRWSDRNREWSELLAERFEATGVLHDVTVSVRVARWAYGQVERAGGQVWVERSVLRPLGEGWAGALAG
jgi:hypothetical protein